MVFFKALEIGREYLRILDRLKQEWNIYQYQGLQKRLIREARTKLIPLKEKYNAEIGVREDCLELTARVDSDIALKLLGA